MRLESPSVARVPVRASSGLLVSAFVLAGMGVLLALPVALEEPALLGHALVVVGPMILAGIALVIAGRPLRALGRRWSGTPSVVTCDAQGLRVGDTEVTGVRSALREDVGIQEQVVIDTARDQWVIAVTSTEDADALVEALGFGVEQRAVPLEVAALGERHYRVLFALTATACVYFVVATMTSLIIHARESHAQDLLPPLLGWVFFVLTARQLVVRTVTIGRDGITVKSALSRTTFIPYGGMHTAKVHRSIRLRSGRRSLRLWTSSASEAYSIVSRIEAARALHDARPSPRASNLARNGRSLAEWRASIAQLHGYRGLAYEDLVAVAEDPSAPSDERIAAVAALAKHEHARMRISQVVATTVEPKLRLALERAHDGEIDAAAIAATARR